MHLSNTRIMAPAIPDVLSAGRLGIFPAPWFRLLSLVKEQEQANLTGAAVLMGVQHSAVEPEQIPHLHCPLEGNFADLGEGGSGPCKQVAGRKGQLKCPPA